MKLSNKRLTLILAFLLHNVFVFSQDSYEWDDHNEAMDDINWNDSIKGWLMLFVIIGIFYLIHKFISNIKKK
jgi:hypothetical protein